LTGGLGLDLSLDTQGGSTIQPSLSLGYSGSTGDQKYNYGASISAPISSRAGLTDLSLGFSYSPPSLTGVRAGKNVPAQFANRPGGAATSISGGGTLMSFANRAHAPFVGPETEGEGFSGVFKLGGSAWGLFGSVMATGFLDRQGLKHANSAVGSHAFGYLYLQHGTDNEAVLDFNREKDGLVRKNTPNLAIPQLTYDLYNASGPDIAGTFRAFRSDYGILSDPRTESGSIGGGGGFEIGAGGLLHWGADASITSTETVAGRWTDDTLLPYRFTDTTATEPAYEPFYFKFVGEQSSPYSSKPDPLNDIGGAQPVRVPLGETDLTTDLLQGDYQTFPALDSLRLPNGYRLPAAQRPITNDRIPRQSTIQAFTNGSLQTFGAALPELIVTYVNGNHVDTLSRSGRPASQIGAFIITGPTGTRNVYALPVYNSETIEEQFSVRRPSDSCGPTVDYSGNHKPDSTDGYLRRTKTPAYAHSYLLTAVLGPDYADVDGIPGATDGDFGHWVRLTYKRVTTQYKWRAPFSRALFNPGYENSAVKRDDRGSLMWGVRELWYLARAETRSHLAEFRTSPRRDSKGAQALYQRNNEYGESSYKLDRIDLYSKFQALRADGTISPTAVPIKTINFEYTYQLAEAVPNHDALVSDSFQHDVTLGGTTDHAGDQRPGRGKLTLKQMWFTYENSGRGALSPYTFGYAEGDPRQNPNYLQQGEDRWGTYRSYSNYCEVSAFPYTSQHGATATLDTAASVWHLKNVVLPSGGTVKIDYEADRYAYVQNKPAMQMVRVVGVAPGPSPDIDDSSHSTAPANRLYRRVYFELERPIPLAADTVARIARYVEGVDQVYFKTRIRLKTSSEELWEYVAGYANLTGGAYGTAYGLDGKISQGSQDYYRLGWVLLDRTLEFHPFSVAAWQHLRLNQPELISPAPPITPNPSSSPAEELVKVVQLAGYVVTSAAHGVFELLKGFNGRAFEKDWGTQIDTTRSWIRLNTPDGEKIGGGVRVARIVINDTWDQSTGAGSEPSQTVGRVFDYTLPDGSSSGVAAYEPMVGGEENPMRSAKEYTEEVRLASDYNLFFEYPINEAYFPGPVVGYSRVTVRSLAADSVRRGQMSPQVPTTGQTVHTFYTARDFPVRTDETEILRRPFDFRILVPFIGDLSIGNLTASQGYVAQVNDMHGRPRSVEEYAFDDSGHVGSAPVSSTEYFYNAESRLLGGGQVEFDLRDYASVMGMESGTFRVLGRDYDFFVDMRQSKTVSWHGGLRINSDVMQLGPFPVPFPVPWPNVGLAINEARTVVANKVIYRSGVVTETRVNNGGALATTRNRTFDGMTGAPRLSTVNTAFNDSVYMHTMPAHWSYDGMGPAYRNAGIRFSATITADPSMPLRYKVAGGFHYILLTVGDELAVSTTTTDGPRVVRAWVHEVNSNVPDVTVQAERDLGGSGDFLLVRSGRRNLLNAVTADIRALRNPLATRADSCSKKEFIVCGVDFVDRPVLTATKCATNLFAYLAATRARAAGGEPITPGRRASEGARLRQCLAEFAFAARAFGIDQTWRALSVRSLQAAAGRERCGLSLRDAQGRPQNPQKLIPNGRVTAMLAPPDRVLTDPRSGYPFAGLAVGVGNRSDSVVVYLFSNCGKWTETRTERIAVPRICERTLTAHYGLIDSVLDISLTRFRSTWAQTFGDVRFVGDAERTTAETLALDDISPFANGTEGVWRPSHKYDFLSERRRSNPINLRRDGTYGNVAIFDWSDDLPFACQQGWQRRNEITQYSPYGYELERRDVLSVYTASLFGYRGSVNTAFAQNAYNREIGFEGFEEYSAGQQVDATSVATGNIDFYTAATTEWITVGTTVATALFGDAGIVTINPRPWLTGGDIDPLPLYGDALVGLERIRSVDVLPGRPRAPADFARAFAPLVRNRDTAITVLRKAVPEGIPAGRYSIHALGRTSRGEIVLALEGLTPDSIAPPGRPPIGRPPLVDPRIGWVRLQWERRPSRDVIPRRVATVAVSSSKAHTGRNSLQINAASPFEQLRLKLATGKKYLLAAWVSRLGDDVPTFRSTDATPPAEKLGLQVVFLNAAGDEIGRDSLAQPEGPVIEGWQQINREFTLPTDAARITIIAQNGTASAYFDDLRISPADANMETYVYDPMNYRLLAKLDANNFAELYGYDEEGALHLLRQETVRGIMTTREIRAHVRERP
jgi:hypothetical protein